MPPKKRSIGSILAGNEATELRNFNAELDKTIDKSILANKSFEDLGDSLVNIAANNKNLNHSQQETVDLAKEHSKVGSKILDIVNRHNKGGLLNNVIAKAKFGWLKLTSNKHDEIGQNLLKQTGEAIKHEGLQAKLGKLYGLADDLLGGMLSTMKGFINPWTAVLAIGIAFSGTLDEIGKTFGAIGIHSLDVRNSLMDAQVEATKLGKSMEDVLLATTQLTDNFGVGLSEALKLSSSVLDTSVALGLSTEATGDLIGSFKTLVGLSADQAVALAKNVTLLAKASDVAPQQILRDMAEASQEIAGFADATGTNIARAAIQARKLGLALSEVAASAKSLLDFQSTYQNSLEASVLVGREINVERMMELSLAGDLEGLQKEQIKQLGTQAEWGRLNVLQREALAQAVGLSVDQAAKFINKEKEAVTLAGQLAGQPGFDELVGEKGISTLTRLTGGLKSLGATLTNSLGPILNIVLKLLLWVGKALEIILKPINAVFRAMNMGMEGTVTPTGIPSLRSEGLITKTGVAEVHAGESVGVFNEKVIVDAIEKMSDKLANLQLNTKITNKDLNVVLTPSKA